EERPGNVRHEPRERAVQQALGEHTSVAAGNGPMPPDPKVVGEKSHEPRARSKTDPHQGSERTDVNCEADPERCGDDADVRPDQDAEPKGEASEQIPSSCRCVGGD